MTLDQVIVRLKQMAELYAELALFHEDQTTKKAGVLLSIGLTGVANSLHAVCNFQPSLSTIDLMLEDIDTVPDAHLLNDYVIQLLKGARAYLNAMEENAKTPSSN